MRVIIFLIPVIAAGCAARMVQPPGTSSQSEYDAVNQADRPGTVRYLNDGAVFVTEARRINAQKLMWEACAGKYQIINEGEKNSGAVGAALSPTTAIALPMRYWYIEFECVKE